jgi:hypothetical protein
LIVQKNWVNGKYFTLILLRDLTLRFVTCQFFYIHSIQITNYNISGVNVAIVALNYFVNYAKECQCCMQIEKCVDSLHSDIVICDARSWSRAIMYIIQQLMTRYKVSLTFSSHEITNKKEAGIPLNKHRR